MQLFLLHRGVWKWTFRKYCPHFFLHNFGLTVIEIAQDANSQNGNFLEHCGDIILHITYVEAV